MSTGRQDGTMREEHIIASQRSHEKEVKSFGHVRMIPQIRDVKQGLRNFGECLWVCFSSLL